MSTAASNQSQRGGRRQPFGFLNANTLPSASSAAAKGGSGSDGSVGSAGSSMMDPVKSESKRKMRGILSSIATRSSESNKNDGSSRAKHEREGSGSALGGDEDAVLLSMLESPTKKIRVTMEEHEEDSKPSSANSATHHTTYAEAAAMSISQSQMQDYAESRDDSATTKSVDAPLSSSSIFRQPPDDSFWNDGMEDMLELQLANPILDESVDCGEEFLRAVLESAETDASLALSKEPREDNASGGEPISWSNRIQEDESEGFKIRYDP